jgi:hypothetical protein
VPWFVLCFDLFSTAPGEVFLLVGEGVRRAGQVKNEREQEGGDGSEALAAG